MNPRVSVLKDEFTEKDELVRSLDETCADEKRDLTDDERANYDAAVTRMEAISDDIQKINTRTQKFDAVAAVNANVNASTPAPARTAPRAIPSLGEYVKTRALHSLGKIDDAEMDTLTRVLAHGVSTDGSQPTTIEGDLINFVESTRHAVNAVRRLPLPDNKASTFERPRVTQHTAVDIQANEGDVLASQRLKTSKETVEKVTFGGTVALSEQEIDWTTPAMLGATTQDLAEQYAIETDDYLCSAIETASRPGATPDAVLSTSATAAQVIAAVLDSAMEVYSDSKRMADTLFLAPDRWAHIAGLVATDGRPAFPMLNATNSAGSNSAGVTSFTGLNIMGLKVVVDPNFTSGFWATAAPSLIEFYEQNKGLLSVDAPSTLETVVAYRGYVAVNIYYEGVRHLEAA